MKKIIALFLLFIVGQLQAQENNSTSTDSTKLIILSTNSGEHFAGFILAEDPREVTIRLQNGKLLSIPAYTIKSIKPATKENIIGGKVVYPNPHQSRYFYTPSALPMDKGEVYIQTVYGVAFQAQFGITDRFSLGATTTIVGTPLALTTKYSIPVDEKNTLAIGGLAGFVGWGSNVSLGIGFGTYTYGIKESNITLGTGLAWVRDGDVVNYTPTGEMIGPFAETNSTGIFTLAGNKRLSRNLSIMGEFWYVPEGGLFFGGPGFRLYNNRKSTFDLGIWTIGGISDVSAPIFPVFSYTFKFEK
jgi:hypothetical protein